MPLILCNKGHECSFELKLKPPAPARLKVRCDKCRTPSETRTIDAAIVNDLLAGVEREYNFDLGRFRLV